MEPLITPRLMMRQLTIGDLDALVPLHAEASFWQYPMGRGQTRAETSAFLDRIIRSYEPANAASGHVMDKLGFEWERETVDTVRALEVRVTALTRARWSDLDCT